MKKHVFITGGASGIGLQLARDYVAAGCDVSLFDIQPTTAAVTGLRQQAKTEQQVQAYSLDVTSADGVVAAFQEASCRQRPHLVIHCAGIVTASAFVDTSEALFSQIITVNLLGSRHVAAAALAVLPAGGQLVLVASMAGLVGCYGYSAYSASKYGVVGLAEVLRIEFAPKAIDVLVVCPPEVETPMVVEERKLRPKETETLKLMAGTLSVEQAAMEIRRGIEKRTFLIIPGVRARLVWLTNRWLPGAVTRSISDLVVQAATKRAKS